MDNKFFKEIYDNLISKGFIEVDHIGLSDGIYHKEGGGYEFKIKTFDYDRKNNIVYGYKFTGWWIVTRYGIRGFYNNQDFEIKNGKIVGLLDDDYRIFTNDTKFLRNNKLKQLIE